MPPLSNFSRRSAPPIPSPRQSEPIVRVDLRGLDMSSPYDVMKKNRTPYARNFRIYAEESDDRRVTISSRKGSGVYTQPQGEGISVSQTGTTDSDYANLGIESHKADQFVPTTTGTLTRIAVEMKHNDASGALVLEVRADDSGTPGVLLAESGSLGSAVESALSYVDFRFVEAPLVTSGTTYWFVIRQQRDSTGNYQVSTSTDTTTALTSNNGGLSWDALSVGINYRAYVSANLKVKGLARYTPTSGTNQTILYIGNNLYRVNDGTGALTSIVSGLNASATHGYFAQLDDKLFFVNGYDTMRTWNGTTASTLTHSQLPVARYVFVHKERLWVVSASETNKIVFSEVPGNDDGAGKFWYEAYLSTNYRYVPTPKAKDPITAIIPFQDTLVIFTTTGKYVLYGANKGSFTLRESTGKKGATHQNGVFADENYIYFVADDGFYRFNGSVDEIISDLTDRGGGSVQPEYNNIADLTKVFVTKWKRQVRFYYPTTGSSVNNRCLVFHTVFQEWMLDTDSYVSHAMPLIDGDDSRGLVEASSTAPMAHYAEVDDNNLGKAIEFIYHCPYDSMGNPALRKRIVRFFPLLEGEDSNYTVNVGMDKDLENTPRYYEMPLEVGGALIGEFNLDSGVPLGNFHKFSPTRIRIPGYGYYWQPRVEHKAINNPINFLGYVISLRTKRL